MFDFFKSDKSNDEAEEAAEERLQSEVDIAEEDASSEASQVVLDSGENLPSDKVCDLVDYVVSGIIDHPEELQLEVTDTPGATLIEIRANKEDFGKIIGKQGNTIKSLRVLARALGSRLGLMVDIQVLDE